MATAGSTALSGDTWTKIFDRESDGAARALLLRSLSTSANNIEVLSSPNTTEDPGTPTGSQDAYTLEPGAELPIAAGLGVDGAIDEVWARSSGATLTHTVLIQ